MTNREYREFAIDRQGISFPFYALGIMTIPWSGCLCFVCLFLFFVLGILGWVLWLMK